MEGVEPTHPYGYQILSLARLPIPTHRPDDGPQHHKAAAAEVNRFPPTFRLYNWPGFGNAGSIGLWQGFDDPDLPGLCGRGGTIQRWTTIRKPDEAHLWANPP